MGGAAGPVRGQRKEEAYRSGATPYVVVEGSRQGTSSRDSSCRKEERKNWKDGKRRCKRHGCMDGKKTMELAMKRCTRSFDHLIDSTIWCIKGPALEL
jgi:hypothetical protein